MTEVDDIEAQTPPEAAAEAASEEKEESKDQKQPLASLRDVLSFGAGPTKRFCLSVGFFCAIVTGCAYPALAFFFAKSFEELGASTGADGFMDNIRTLAFTFMILGAVVGVSMTVQATLLETAAGIMTADLKTKWFEALLRQDLAYHDIKDVSGTASIISSNAAKYKKGVGRKLGEGMQFLITFFGGLGYAFYASWRTSLVILTVLPVMALSTLFMVKITQSQSSRAQKGYAEAGSIVFSTISAIRTVLSLNAVRRTITKFVEATQRAYQGAASQVHLVGLANGSMMGSFLLSYVAVTLFGAYLLYDAVRDTGCDPSGTVEENETCNPSGMDVLGSLFGITFAAAVLPQVSVSVEAITGARAACYPAIEVMNRKVGSQEEEKPTENGGAAAPLPEYTIDSSSPDGKKPASTKGDIQFHDVTFAYPTRSDTKVFNGFSLTVQAGKTVALVGPSGGGKSTAIQLVERFYDPDEGSVTLDGTDLRELNVRWLREQIALVSQEPRLFAASIRDNIAYGLPGATQEQIEDAAKLANAHDFICSFPEGYDTQVGDKGAQLSGGQKQRVAIARVLVKNPKILLLDEATSALDSESESVVQKALDQLLEVGHRTTIVIAHRLSTIRNADLIAVVDGGKVVETGTHDELIAAQGHYYQLVEAQKGKTAKPVVKSGETDSGPPSRRESGVGDPGMDNSSEGAPVVRFRHVHFQYPSRPDNEVFRGLSLAVNEGETLALVGPSGQGKSTVVQLIERFYDPSSGSVELDGVDLKEINVEWLRDQIGLVSQEPTLFNTTIAENIKFGTPDATQEEIESAARQANAHDFITSFPEGYSTLVGESGSQVSGGQKQRIAIARAIIKKPKILLLDEATSALDSESERVVQDALDHIMTAKSQTTIVIAHRLSTTRNADRIAVIARGKIREIGTHDELMALENGHYRRLQAFQNLDQDQDAMSSSTSPTKERLEEATKKLREADNADATEDEEHEVDKEKEKKNAQRARLLAKEDNKYFFVGGIGALLTGLVFPSWGFIFAYMIKLLYNPVAPCEDNIPPEECQADLDSVAEDMQQLSFNITYVCLGIIGATMIGNMLLFYGFGTASEKMNKRVRDAAFTSLVRQEVGYFDLRSVGDITSQLEDDAAMIHSFSGEPIRTLIMNLASLLVGLVVSFVFMWPFALLVLAILPFMAFGAEAEMRMYIGDDDTEKIDEDEHSPGGIVVETLVNIRTVAALTIEERRLMEYEEALRHEDPTPLKTNLIKGSTSGLGQFIQMWGTALMFWWGGWLLDRFPSAFEYRDFLISMFSLLFSLSGTAVAAQGATNKEKARAAADRIFELIDRQSAIDPLADEGKKGV